MARMTSGPTENWQGSLLYLCRERLDLSCKTLLFRLKPRSTSAFPCGRESLDELLQEWVLRFIFAVFFYFENTMPVLIQCHFRTCCWRFQAQHCYFIQETRHLTWLNHLCCTFCKVSERFPCGISSMHVRVQAPKVLESHVREGKPCYQIFGACDVERPCPNSERCLLSKSPRHHCYFRVGTVFHVWFPVL